MTLLYARGAATQLARWQMNFCRLTGYQRDRVDGTWYWIGKPDAFGVVPSIRGLDPARRRKTNLAPLTWINAHFFRSAFWNYESPF